MQLLGPMSAWRGTSSCQVYVHAFWKCMILPSLPARVVDKLVPVCARVWAELVANLCARQAKFRVPSRSHRLGPCFHGFVAFRGDPTIDHLRALDRFDLLRRGDLDRSWADFDQRSTTSSAGPTRQSRVLFR